MSQDVLQRIVAKKREEILAFSHRTSPAELNSQALDTPPARDFLAALQERPGHAIIAEIKRSSPSAGKLAKGVDPTARGRAYEAGGAAAISVLTDKTFFDGSLDDLRLVREACSLPILRKDFIISLAQIYEARAAGADAVLLIAAALEQDQLAEFSECINDLGMTPLIEVHDQQELERVLGLKPQLIGINNRNLKSLEVDLSTCLRLRPLIPSHISVVAESGVSGPDDINLLRKGGLDAFLVGSSLMRADDPVAELQGMIKSAGGYA